ncbi:radical SAM protein [Myxococcota bacterium]
MRSAAIDAAKNGWRLLRRNAACFVILNRARARGASYVPHPRRRLFIEPISYCNLACKFCPYSKHMRERTIMDDALFRSCIDQAAQLGYRNIVLTPIGGDVFVDKHFLTKAQYLEDHSGTMNFEFYSNFVDANEATIAALLNMKRLRRIEISVYGHDRPSFRNITTRDSPQYDRIVENLQTLNRMWPTIGRDTEIVVSVRTYRSCRFDQENADPLYQAIRSLRRHGLPVSLVTAVDDWGGTIRRRDMSGVDMDLLQGGRFLYRKGACVLPFDAIQIAANGSVHVCACRDVGGDLTIGNIRTEPLAQIISSYNKKWLGMIAAQDAGRFTPVCASCSFYQSIHDSRRIRDSRNGELMTKETFFRILSDECR